MAKNRITVIGTGFVGTTIGLALRSRAERPGEKVEVVGHDAEPSAARRAQQLGAFDRTEWNLSRACDGAGIVILALPVDQIRETLGYLADTLSPGTLVTDTANLKVPVLAWADELLPDGVHFVGGDPILSARRPPPVEERRSAKAARSKESPPAPDAPRADLLQGAVWCLTPSTSTHAGATDRVAQLVQSLGAVPFYLDPLEHDGLMAGVDSLPALLALALVRATVGTPGWQDMRKVAGSKFAAATGAVAGSAAGQRASVLLNADTVLQRLDLAIADLQRLREWIAQGDADSLEQAFAGAAAGRATWEQESAGGLWEPPTSDFSEVPTAAEVNAQLLTGRLVGRHVKKGDRRTD